MIYVLTLLYTALIKTFSPTHVRRNAMYICDYHFTSLKNFLFDPFHCNVYFPEAPFQKAHINIALWQKETKPLSLIAN